MSLRAPGAFVFFVFLLFESGCICHRPSVAFIVEPALAPSIRTGLDQFAADLHAEGYRTFEYTSGFADPPSLRNYLKGLYSGSGHHLVGAILIGDSPHAYQWVTLVPSNPNIPPISEEAISFQYYADLDGTFAQSPGYASPNGHPYSYDVHSGNVDWEIWIALLPRYKGDLPRSITAVNKYFAKNHAYRTGKLALPKAFLQVNEHAYAATVKEHNSVLADMQSGVYSWTPYSNLPTARLYFDSPPVGLSVAQGYADLQSGVADFTVVDSHGSWAAGGQLTIAAVESLRVKTTFFWSNGCAVGDLDHADNFLTSVLYAPTSEVLVAKGTTNDSGGLGTNSNGFFGHNIATALASGTTFGTAVLQHVNQPLIAPWSSDREFYLGTPVILGDPTLRR